MGWFSRKPANRLTKLTPLELRGRQARNQMQVDAIRDEMEQLERDYKSLVQACRLGETDVDIQIRATHAKQLSDRRKLRAVDLTAHLQASSQYSLLISYAERVGERAAIIEEELDSLLRLGPTAMRKVLDDRAKDVEKAKARTSNRAEVLSSRSSTVAPIELDNSEELRMIEDASLPPIPPTPSSTKATETRERVAELD